MNYRDMIRVTRALGMPTGRRIALADSILVEPTVWPIALTTKSDPTDVIDLADPSNSVDPSIEDNLPWNDSQSDVSILWYGAELVIGSEGNQGDAPTPEDIDLLKASMYLRYQPAGQSFYYPLWDGTYTETVYRQITQASAADATSTAHGTGPRFASWRFNLYIPQLKAIKGVHLHQRPCTLSGSINVQLRLHGLIAAPSIGDAPGVGDCDTGSPPVEVARELTQARVLVKAMQ